MGRAAPARAQLFYRVTEEKARQAELYLVGMVCYYGRHYSTFFFQTRIRRWMYFDDAHVKEVGSLLIWLSSLSCFRSPSSTFIFLARDHSPQSQFAQIDSVSSAGATTTLRMSKTRQ